jgi:serine/threonine-protein kinase
MSSPSSPESSERERRLEEILAAVLAAEDAGQTPELESLLTQHPDLADELRAFLGAYDRVRALAAPLRAVAGAAGSLAAITERDAGSNRLASPQPAAVPSETTTEALEATVELTHNAADDPDATAPVTPNDPLERDLLDAGTPVRYFGDYELLSVLGRGGMGVVYKARQLSLNRPVALKMLQAGTLANDDDVRRFQNEAEAVAMLDHPHIVPILEVGRYEGQRYFTMKLIGGQSLDRKLGEYTTDPKSAARLVRTVAEAVHHAHQRGILHRDLKPGNVLVDERGEPHVTDFGLAKRVHADSELTQSGAILGTPAYMGPEQASGKRGMVTTATDVYGLGAILYALLTGRAPFAGDSPVDTLEQVRGRKPEPPSKRNPRVPRDLEVICLKCLEKDPAQRYVSAEALADDLRRYLSGESILARPVWLATRAWMWCKRNPVLARLAAALLLAALLAAVGVVVMERARRREAEVRKEVETNFIMAQKAVEDYLTRIRENALLKEQDSVDIRKLRQELLENALQYYQRFVNERSHDPHLRLELANAYFRVGAITQEIGTPQQAIKAFLSARSIWEPLAAANPADPVLQGHLAKCHLAIGKLQAALDNLQGAMQSFSRAQAILEALAVPYPDRPAYQALLANCYSEIGIVQTQVASSDQGLGMLEKAKATQQELIGRYPQEMSYQKSLAEMLNVLGLVYDKRLDYPAALRSFQQVQEICESLLKSITDGPKPVWLLNLLALSHYNIATIELSEHHQAKALQSFEKSLEYRSALVAAHPSVTKFQENLGKSYREIAHRQHDAGLDAKARTSIRKSLDVLTRLVQAQPDQARYHSELGLSWNTLGYLYDEARENAQAIPAFQKAVAEQQLAGRTERGTMQLKVYLENHLDNLGEQYVDLGRVAEGCLITCRQFRSAASWS